MADRDFECGKIAIKKLFVLITKLAMIVSPLNLVLMYLNVFSVIFTKDTIVTLFMFSVFFCLLDIFYIIVVFTFNWDDPDRSASARTQANVIRRIGKFFRKSREC
jgi:hypothetical protein